MSKHVRLFLCLACALCLAGCQSGGIQSTSARPLSPAVSAYAAPADDAAMAYTALAALYLPSLDGQRLLCQYTPVPMRHDRHPAEGLVRALLEYSGNSLVRPLGDGTQLALYGTNPVEVAGGVCTVNLASSALMLSSQSLYTVCLALASTLCEIDDIHDVNVLIADQAVGMDITDTLPLGGVKAHPGEELPILWEQMEARRTPLGEDPSTMPVSATATLYFPLADGSGVIPETRSLSFPGQTPQQLAAGLITALSAGAQYVTGTADMPDLNSLMTYAPQVSDMMEGGRLVSLRFVSSLEERLQGAGVDLGCFIAALTDTLTTFIPSVTAVQVEIGAIPLTGVSHPVHDALRFTDGIIRRNAFSAYLMDQATLYFAHGDRLTPVTRALPALNAASPRQLLLQLMAGPRQQEADAGVQPTLPEDLTDADILGIALEGDTLLLNLSGRFAALIRTEGASYEQLLCYSIVNTLCEAKGLKRVLFFFDGEAAETLGGTLYWGGEFLLCPGLIDRTKG